MAWGVECHALFVPEFDALAEAVQVDTLQGSRFANMKELRFEAAGGVWRFAFAFDAARRAIVLCGGDKSGVSQKRFYRGLIARADARFASHVANAGQLDRIRKRR